MNWKRFSAVGISLGLMAGAAFAQLQHEEEGVQKLETPTEDIVASREIAPGIVSYAYAGDVVSKHSEQEIVDKRTQTSFTELLRSNEDHSEVYKVTAYAAPAFLLDNNRTWRTIEYATTTTEIFNTRSKQSLFQYLLPRAFADDFFAGAGDGLVAHSNANWNTLHDATTGSNLFDAVSSGQLAAVLVSGTYSIQRLFFPINTSAIPANATIVSATFNFEVQSVSGTNNSGTRTAALVETSQPSHSALTTADFNNTGATDNPTEGASRVTITAAGDLAFTLNPTGLAWIKKSGQSSTCGTGLTGWTCLGMRAAWLDADDVAPTDGSQEMAATIYFSEQTGTTNDPYLTVIYTVPATAGLEDVVIFE
jgi:hypothetical protein